MPSPVRVIFGKITRLDEPETRARRQFWSRKPTNAMKKTILVFGLLAGAVVSGLMGLTMLLAKGNPSHFEWGMVVGYASMLLAFTLIFFALRSYRERHRAGRLTFGEGFRIGLGIAVIASLAYTLTWAVLYKTAFPEYPREYTKYLIDKMRAEGKPAAEISAAQADLDRMFADYDTWPVLLGYTFLEIFPVGLVVALVCALVLKRKVAPVEVGAV